MDSETHIIEHTMNWVRTFIIGYNLCPFAKKAVQEQSLRMAVSVVQKKEQALEALMAEIHLLDENPQIETTLLVFAQAFKDFFTYLDLVDLAEQLLHDLEYEGMYQLATFHPDYYFADTDPIDVSNYTNRSPYPMIHILREERVEKAIKAYGDTSSIPEKNIQTMEDLGIDKIKAGLTLIEPKPDLR